MRVERLVELLKENEIQYTRPALRYLQSFSEEEIEEVILANPSVKNAFNLLKLLKLQRKRPRHDLGGRSFYIDRDERQAVSIPLDEEQIVLVEDNKLSLQFRKMIWEEWRQPKLTPHPDGFCRICGRQTFGKYCNQHQEQDKSFWSEKRSWELFYKPRYEKLIKDGKPDIKKLVILLKSLLEDYYPCIIISDIKMINVIYHLFAELDIFLARIPAIDMLKQPFDLWDKFSAVVITQADRVLNLRSIREELLGKISQHLAFRNKVFAVHFNELHPQSKAFQEFLNSGADIYQFQEVKCPT